MNKSINGLLLSISVLALFIAGCGPEGFTEADHMASISSKHMQDMDQDAPAAAACPMGQPCEIAQEPDTHRVVQLPDQHVVEPTKVIRTAEKQVATDVVDYRTTRHITQPTERHHTVHQHRNQVNRHFTKNVYHPTFRRINNVVTTASAAEEVMPTEEVVAPMVDYGCAMAEPVVPVVAVTPVVRPMFARPFMW